MEPTSGLTAAGGLFICLCSVSKGLLLKFSGASGDLFTRDRGSEAGWGSLPGLTEGGGLTFSLGLEAGWVLGETEVTGAALLTRDRGSEERRVGASLSWAR